MLAPFVTLYRVVSKFLYTFIIFRRTAILLKPIIFKALIINQFFGMLFA